MTRPSRNVDQKLISVARDLIPKTGVTGLTLRQVAEEAQVNLGMFHYYFKSKDEFIKRVLETIYFSFFNSLKESTGNYVYQDPKRALREALLMIGQFIKSNRPLIFSLIKDVMNGNHEVFVFFQKHMKFHLEIVFQILEEGVKKGVFKNYHPVVLLSFMGPSVAAPSVMAELFEREVVAQKFKKNSKKNSIDPEQDNPKFEILNYLLSDEALNSRIDLVMEAVCLKDQNLGDV